MYIYLLFPHIPPQKNTTNRRRLRHQNKSLTHTSEI